MQAYCKAPTIWVVGGIPLELLDQIYVSHVDLLKQFKII